MVIIYSKLFLFCLVFILSIFISSLSNIINAFIFAASSILAYFSGYGLRESVFNQNAYQKSLGIIFCLIIIGIIVYANITFGVSSLLNGINIEMILWSIIFLLRLINFFD
tara:strand:+ start:1257 stop:1586 length:330 start_codon:yes stop_codon:yes gene_type:complete